MKKSLINYGLISLAMFVATVLIVSFTSSDTKGENEAQTPVTTTTTTTVPTTTVPPATFVEDANSAKIPDPCTTITIENVNKFAPGSVVRGPLGQNSLAPTMGCIWSVQGNDNPKLGVSIILLPTAIDSAEAEKIKDVAVGEKAFLIEGFKTGFQNTSCGQTIYVKKGDFSFMVAYCPKNPKGEEESTLIELATGVANSLG